MIEIGEDYITISDEKGEIVHWVSDEWEEDPSIVLSIANAINLFHTQGTKYLRTLLKK